MAKIKPIFITACLLCVTACSANQQGKDSRLALMKTTNPRPIVTVKTESNRNAAAIKRDVSSIPGIYDVAVVKGKKNVLVVYKVKHLHRFKMKKIEKQIKERLEKKYSNEKFTVSSDYKIFLEAIRLKERMQKDKKFSDQDAEKRIKQLIKMTEAMT